VTRHGALALALLALHGGAAAAGPSVFGLELGHPVALAECPHQAMPVSGRKLYELMPSRTCVEDAAPAGPASGARTVVFTRTEAPPIVRDARLTLLEVGGALAGVRFATPGESAEDVVLGELTAKYGPPSSIHRERVQNLAGAQADTLTALWRGGVVDVTFYGTFGRLDQGQVTIDLPIGSAARRARDAAAHNAERKL